MPSPLTVEGVRIAARALADQRHARVIAAAFEIMRRRHQCDPADGPRCTYCQALGPYIVVKKLCVKAHQSWTSWNIHREIDAEEESDWVCRVELARARKNEEMERGYW